MSATVAKMSRREFARRVNHNTRILKAALATKESLINILPKLYTYTTEPGKLHSSVIIRNAHDMLPAAYLGLLVNVHNNGVDAYEVDKNGVLIFYELKTSEVPSDLIWKGAQGGLYLGNSAKKSQTVGLTSHLHASYQFTTEAIINSKRMRTILMVCDTNGEDGYFDAWELDGDIVVDHYIKGRTGNITIKLGSFMKNGHRATTVVPLRGFEDWREEVAAKAPRKVIESY